ncbi:hypothetical protein [Sphingobium sp. BS19]|uniref:hypothetical protein n=1 Tax=Sphingobium sp. BS19 TaxID=3018973 RepID=UPI0022EE8D07|nr:hypothetical protein [Sphingobium sp. BS19]GLI99134.1 hypothetical protein Sbs19_29520 [Sphingobium sp. BS19]
MQIKNISTGDRGIRTTDGTLVMLAPNEVADLDVSDAEMDDAADWFEFKGASKPQEPGPLDGNVDDLKDYLDTVSNPDEVQKLIDAETGGKSRAGALKALEARRDELLAA